MSKVLSFIGLMAFVAVRSVAESFETAEDAGSHVAARARVEHHRNARKNVARAATSLDSGDVVVLVDNGSLILPPRPGNAVDLSNRSFTFEPVDRGFRIAPASLPLDPSTGTQLALGDDSTAHLPLPFAFPFLGTSYAELYVNSDGNVTFGRGDVDVSPRDAARMISGPPRVAPLLIDLDVTAGGAITADVRQDRAVFTWSEVPEFGTSHRNTMQLTLYASGAIDFVYGTLQTTAPFSDAVTGVTNGNNSTPFLEIDFGTLRGHPYHAAAIFEEFGFELLKQVDIVQVAKEFYRTHPDHYDMLVLFTNFEVTLFQPSWVAFYDGIQNHTRGLGIPDYDESGFYGSDGELEGIIHMNDVRRYWSDERKLLDPPIEMFAFPGGASTFFPPGDARISRRARKLGTLPKGGSWNLGLHSPISILAHESLHRWAAYVPFVHPQAGIGPDSLDLLGRQLAHWSFFFNTRVPDSQFAGDPRSSSMEGNVYRDFGSNVFGDCAPGQTRFRTHENELMDGYTELDQYLMGVRHAEEVGPFWYVDNPRSAVSGSSYEGVRVVSATDDVGVCGNRVDLTLANIQAFPGVGPRIPAIGDEDDDGRGNDVKTQAFILVVESASGSSESARQVDTFRRVYQEYVNGPASSGRGKFDTSLNPVVH